MSEQKKQWLLRQENIRKLWIIFIAILLVTVVAGLFVHQHEAFSIEDSFGFFAWYGFISCIGMVIFAKLLGLLLKRPEDYYMNGTDSGSNMNSNKDQTNHD